MSRAFAFLTAALLANAVAATPSASASGSSSAGKPRVDSSSAATSRVGSFSAATSRIDLFSAVKPRIEGSWNVRATVMRAQGGARPRAGAKRRASYEAHRCSAPCRVRLSEQLPGGGRARIDYTRSGRIYSGEARTRLRCAGERVRARVADNFQISRAVRRAGRRLAANLAGTATISGSCGGAPARLVVRWTAVRSDLPEPPTAAFTSEPDPVSLSIDGGVATFVDASIDDLDGGRIVGREWDFGDPASGAANNGSGAQVTHTYTTPGSFTVKLTVTDDDGLRATVRDVVVVEP